MKKLFLSYSALLKGVSNGSVSQTDLDEGLFYFGCCREQVFAAWTDEAPLRIMTAVQKAEANGRIIWRTRFGGNTYQQLGELLLTNGFDAVATYDTYNYGIAAERVRQAGLALEVITR
jgi:hypothetical protein